MFLSFLGVGVVVPTNFWRSIFGTPSTALCPGTSVSLKYFFLSYQKIFLMPARMFFKNKISLCTNSVYIACLSQSPTVASLILSTQLKMSVLWQVYLLKCKQFFNDSRFLLSGCSTFTGNFYLPVMISRGCGSELRMGLQQCNWFNH